MNSHELTTVVPGRAQDELVLRASGSTKLCGENAESGVSSTSGDSHVHIRQLFSRMTTSVRNFPAGSTLVRLCVLIGPWHYFSVLISAFTLFSVLISALTIHISGGSTVHNSAGPSTSASPLIWGLSQSRCLVAEPRWLSLCRVRCRHPFRIVSDR